MEISLIVATDLNGGIGKDGGMPWGMSLKKDLKFFSGKTSGCNIIMGRKTMESLPKGFLPNRNNIVISNGNIENDNIILANSIDDAIDKCDKDKRTYVIGGSSIYNQFIDIADKIFITKIHAEFACDTFFPELDDTWYCDFQSTIQEDGNYNIQFHYYYKKRDDEVLDWRHNYL